MYYNVVIQIPKERAHILDHEPETYGRILYNKSLAADIFHDELSWLFEANIGFNKEYDFCVDWDGYTNTWSVTFKFENLQNATLFKMKWL